MKNKKVLKNAVSSVLIYGVLLLFSVFTSKIVLVEYGSETNGLLSSVNQIFSYIALLEAGIGTATITALFKPLSDKDENAVNDVLASSRAYYRKVVVWYFLCVVVMSVVWPLVLDTEIPYFTIFGLIFLQGISGVITFSFTSTILNYLVASGRNYVNNNVHIIISLLTYAAKLVICYAGLNIVFISLSSVVINIIKCVFYLIYMRKICPEFFKKRRADTSLLKQRSSFLVHEISGVIFSSTDTIVLSVFCGLAEASIYAVYSMVLTAVNNVIGQVTNGTYYVLGDSYAKDREKYKHTHDLFNSVYIFAVFSVFTTVYVMLLPFISLYTSGITDANYMDPKLPILFVLIQLLSACRVVDNQLIKIALHAKQTINRTIIESAINLSVSLILVQFMGIYGVLLGTIAALFYRVNDFIIYTNTKILGRSPFKEYKLYAANFALFALIVFVNGRIDFSVGSYWQLILIAAVVFVVVCAAFMVLNCLINIKDIKTFFSKRREAKSK